MSCQNNYKLDSFAGFFANTNKKTRKNSDNVKWFKVKRDIG